MTSGEDPSASARGGQNNELGSLYRAGVAAYLAAHALSSQPAPHIGLSDEDSMPLVIKVESDEAVDDLLSESDGGGRLLIQAKRTCGMDKQFRKTVDQWVAAVRQGAVGTNDHVVLVTRQAKGRLRDLNGALDRQRNPDAQAPSRAEQKALGDLMEAVGNRLDEGQLDLLLNAALVIELPVENDRDSAFREAARLLEGTVVSAGRGHAAMRSLQHHFQSLGARRWASDRDRWREVLRDANLELLADPHGGWSARQTATQVELAAYQSHIAARLGRFPLNLLSTDLPPMNVEDLVDTFQVALPDSGKSSRQDGLADVCRRWGRLVVVGLPGSGKSTALEQIAALWASRDDAPVPIVVRLGAFVRGAQPEGTPVTLRRLVEHAVSATEQDAAILVPELVRRCKEGEAALLLDGLDECRGAAAVVADEVTAIAARLPDATSLILTTRGSAAAAASKLGLPEVKLVEPNRLEATLDLLLGHVAQHRVDEPGRQAWIKERSQRLEGLRSEASQLLHVPLLAVLLVLLISDEGDPRPGIGRAELLWEVVKHSVKRWELSSETAPDSFAANEYREMLLDAFAEIGHALAESSNVTRSAGEEAVAAHFVVGWGCAPREASAAADEAVSFWDDRVGVFVSTPPCDVLEPRSKVFVEIADAVWVSRQPMRLQRTWLIDALDDPDRHDVVLLAADLQPKILDLLADCAEDGRFDAVELAADALSGVAPAPPDVQRRVVGLIEEALTDPPNSDGRHSERSEPGSVSEHITRTVATKQGERDGPAWPLLRRLAQIPLQESLVERRARIFDRLASEEQRILGHALSAVTQLAARGGEPSEPELQHMLALLQTLPPESKPATRKVSRRRIVVDFPSWTPLSGFGDAVVGCIRWLPTLDAELARNCWNAAAQHSSVGHLGRVERLLIRAGNGEVVARLKPDWIGQLANVALDDPWDWMRLFYGIVARAATPSQLTLSQAWKLEELAQLAALLGLGELGVRTLGDAFQVSADLEYLIPLCVSWADLDAGTLAAQAAIAAQVHDGGADSEVARVLLVPPAPGTEVRLRQGQIDAEIRDRLIAILLRGADWPFALAVWRLERAGDGGFAAAARLRLGEVPARHRRRAAHMVVVMAANQVETALELLTDDDGLVRVAAAGVVAQLIGDVPEEPRIRAALDGVAVTEDFSMRAAMFTVVVDDDQVDVAHLVELATTPPRHWTCCDCGSKQALTDFDCRECSTGARPSLPEVLQGQLPWYQDPCGSS